MLWLNWTEPGQSDAYHKKCLSGVNFNNGLDWRCCDGAGGGDDGGLGSCPIFCSRVYSFFVLEIPHKKIILPGQQTVSWCLIENLRKRLIPHMIAAD